MSDPREAVDHPAHYGGADNPYEHLKVAEAWGLNYALGSATKYICRAGRKPGVTALEDMRKALFWVQHEVARLEREERQAVAAENAAALAARAFRPDVP